MNWRGVVFDLDGTLADSRLDFAGMRAATGCPEGVGLLEFSAALPAAAERQRVMDIIHEFEMAGARAASWIDGADSELRDIAARSLPIGIFTRNSREAAGLMLKTLGVPCDALIAREDAAPKPDPEGLLKIAAGFELPVAELIYVGDFIYDLEAAANAGMDSCLYDPVGDSPYAAHADYVINSYDELGQLLFGDKR